jgi:hypothetical protein
LSSINVPDLARRRWAKSAGDPQRRLRKVEGGKISS